MDRASPFGYAYEPRPLRIALPEAIPTLRTSVSSRWAKTYNARWSNRQKQENLPAATAFTFEPLRPVGDVFVFAEKHYSLGHLLQGVVGDHLSVQLVVPMRFMPSTKLLTSSHFGGRARAAAYLLSCSVASASRRHHLVEASGVRGRSLRRDHVHSAPTFKRGDGSSRRRRCPH